MVQTLHGRAREQEFQPRGVLSAAMLRRMDAVIDDARGALPRLGLENLDNERKDADGTVTCCMPWNTPTCTSAMYR